MMPIRALVFLVGWSAILLAGCGGIATVSTPNIDDCDECPAAKADKAAAPGPDDVANPLFDSWNACPVGTFTVHETRGPATSPMQVKRRLKTKSDRELTIEVIRTVSSATNQETESTQTVVIPRYLSRSQLSDLPRAPESNQTIDSMGKSFRVGKRIERVQDRHGETEETHWESEGVPGLLVRMESRLVGSPSQAPATITELVGLEMPIVP